MSWEEAKKEMNAGRKVTCYEFMREHETLCYELSDKSTDDKKLYRFRVLPNSKDNLGRHPINIIHKDLDSPAAYMDWCYTPERARWVVVEVDTIEGREFAK